MLANRTKIRITVPLGLQTKYKEFTKAFHDRKVKYVRDIVESALYRGPAMVLIDFAVKKDQKSNFMIVDRNWITAEG